MDIDIYSASEATFIGEDSGDESGTSLAGAGDVNGDGYDDILISSYGGGQGEIYLIFGNAFGLCRDTDLSNADASFLGECWGDEAGYSVSGAGDVNGDGYDDILIGAYRNNEGGDNAGQTYLIHGKASGWSMDSLLSNANASFWGENEWDWSGYSVAGAGDVNGDGYDDIIISAPLNDDVLNDAGQIYLIFGKSSGWNMDTDLSNADASFLGERSISGMSIAGAGDVNGDGYDDILIGSHYGDYDLFSSGNEGQTHLIFGKSSGWNMDTDLSMANASFWGEEENDHSGISVAGAGDVNRDGYDDFLIGAYLNDDGGADAGQTYLIHGMASGWNMNTNLSKANASFWGEDIGDESGYSVAGAGDVNVDGYDDIIIGASGRGWGGETYLIFGKSSGWNMDTDLSTVDASFLGENNGDNTGISVADAGDVNWDGYDDFLIGANYNDDGGSNAGKTYLIMGIENNLFRTDNTQKISTTGEELTFSINISELIPISSVYVEYWYGNRLHSTHVNATMINTYKETWNQTIIIANTTRKLHYFFSAPVDSIFWRNTTMKNISICDNDNPELIMDLTDKSAYTGDVFNFSLEVTDNIDVKSVNIEYWFGIGKHFNLNAIKETENPWTSSITIPSDSLECLHYNITAYDYSGNRNRTQVKDIPVIDNDKPVFIIVNRTATITTGDAFRFSINVIDNIGVSSAFVEYWYGEGIIQNSSLETGEENEWYLEFSVLDTIEKLHYIFHAMDTSNNWNETMQRDVPIIDNDLPEFGKDTSGKYATTGDHFTFEIMVSDNVKLSRVYVNYWCDEEDVLGRLLSGKSTFTTTVTIPIHWTTLHYTFHAVDVAENQKGTEQIEIRVIDNDPPSILDDLTVNKCETGEDLAFSVNASDNIFLSSVIVEYWYGDDIHDNLSLKYLGNHYNGSITTPVNSVDPLHYKIKLMDTSENFNETDPVEVTIIDGIPPRLENIPNITIYQGNEINITLIATDNIGITYYSWSQSPIYTSGARLIGIVDDVGTFLINVVVKDKEENSNYTTFTLTVLSEGHDEDNDRIPDLIEILYGLCPNDDTDATGDLDNDDLTNREEFYLGTDLNNSDTDGDGLSDGYEVKNGYDPLDPTTKESITDTDKRTFPAWIWIVVILIVSIIGIVVGSLIFLKKRKVKTSEEGSVQELITKEMSNISQIQTKPSLMLSRQPTKSRLPISSAPPPSRQQTLPTASLPGSALQIPRAPKPVQKPSQIPNQQPTTTVPAQDPTPPPAIRRE